MHVVPAEGALLEQILDFSFPIWHEGLSRAAYSQWNAAQLKTTWGRDHLHRFALVDDQGTVLASLKRYRYDVRLDGRDGWMCGLGAVITPPAQRGHGYAAMLVERILAREREEGALFASLFSEIGASYYQRLGFTIVPFDEVTVLVKRKGGGAPAMLVRAGAERDLKDIAGMHEIRSSGVRLAVRRSPDSIAYALAKKRLLAGLGPPGLRQVEFFVAEEGASAVAYVVFSQNANGWTLEEAGDRDPAGARLGAILQVLVAREPAGDVPLIRAWWPPSVPVPPQLDLTDRTAARDLFMVKPLADVELPTRADEVFYWRSDCF